MTTDMKILILDTLTELTAKKGLDKVTVKDLVEACHISRQTFYYHFQDILDVFEWAGEQKMKQMLEQGLKGETAEDALLVFVSFTSENHDLIQKLFSSQKHSEIETIFYKAFRTYLDEMFRRSKLASDLSVSDWELMLDFYSHGIGAILKKHVADTPQQQRQLAAKISQLLNGTFIASAQTKNS